MTDSFPPPNSFPPEEPQDQRDPLGFDELLALFIAFSTMGLLLWWGLTRNDGGFDFANLGATASISTNGVSSGDSGGNLVESLGTDEVEGTASFLGVESRRSASQSDDLSDSGSATNAEQGRLFKGVSPGWGASLKARIGAPGQGQRNTSQARRGGSPDDGQGRATGSIASGSTPAVGAGAGTPAAGATGNSALGGTATPSGSPSETVPSETAVNPLSGTEVPPPIDISDVDSESWAYPFVTALYDAGFVPDFPDGKFQPDKLVTRAELAAALEQAFAQSRGDRQLTFKDIPDNYWAAAAIDQAVKTEFMSGYPTGNFQPDETIPRYQVLVALVSGLKLNPTSSGSELLARFPDQAELPEWAEEKVATATEYGLVVGHPDATALRPTFPATRADVAVMIHQALVQAGEMEPIPSEYIIQP